MTTSKTSTSAAVAQHEAGRFDQAESIYHKILAQSPDDLAALIGLGDVLTDAGQPTQALEYYRRAIALDPESTANAGAYDGLAAILQDMGDLDGAVVASKKAAVLRGSAEDALGVGLSLEYLGRNGDALEMFQLAAQLKPDYYDAHAKAGHHLLIAGKAAESIPHYQAAIREKPDVAELHCNLANARRQSGDMNEALDSGRRAIELKPDLSEAHNVMGAVWKDRRRWSDALQSLGRAVQLKPDAADALNNTGIILEAIGRLPEATPYFERAAMLRSDVVEYHLSLASNLLTRGEFARGWDELEWRRMDPRQSAGRVFEQPAWDGSDLSGKTILVHAEQPLGRSILFLRYLPLLRDGGARVIFECPAKLAELARRVDGVADVIVQGEALPNFDVHCPLLSLGAVFKTDLQNMPGSAPYIIADAKKVAGLREKVSELGRGRKIGLAWPETYNAIGDRDRICPPDKLAALAKLSDTTFFALQSSTAPLPGDLKVVDLSSQLVDLDETAAMIENMDVVIGADTAVAHLAAAMGKPTNILLPTQAGWHWLLDREDSPWYPSVRLFRHSTGRSWSKTMDALLETLK